MAATAHAQTIPSPTASDVTLTTPRIPGLEIVIPAGSVVEDEDGDVVTKLSMTAVPTDRPPFPLPSFFETPVYFTVQPGGAYVFPHGARIIYPNYTHQPPGARAEFWNYDPDEKGWYIYGHGRVTPDGKQIVPDPGVRKASQCPSRSRSGPRRVRIHQLRRVVAYQAWLGRAVEGEQGFGTREPNG